MTSTLNRSSVGAVVIGRNEGVRLLRSIASTLGGVGCLVYVDSGSSDGSLEAAASLGVEVVSLDLSKPFSAARARNEGVRRLIEIQPSTRYVQFVDGDCIVDPSWIRRAVAALEQDPNRAVAFGRRREERPESSPYERFCDMEWDVTPGDNDSCGGDSLMRIDAWRQTGGYREELIAGEEPELCVRLRAAGWKIHGLNEPMTYHVAGMIGFGQFARRALRAGHAFAEVSWLHRRNPDAFWKREVRSIWLWGVVIPVGTILGTFFHPASAVAALSYGALAIRIMMRMRRRGYSIPEAWLYSRLCILAKWPQATGQLTFHARRLLGKRTPLIEYKTPLAPPPGSLEQA